MNVDFFIHGVPNGQDIFGLDNDKEYFQKFYSGNNQNNVKFIIETRKKNDKNHCYYTYLKCKDIIAADGRAGSYFGITLRFDVYCNDIVILYSLFEIIFGKYVVGSLLKDDGAKMKYISACFSSKKIEIEKIEEIFLKYISLSFVENDFVRIDESFINKGTTTQEYNLLDCTKKNVFESIKKYSQISIAPNYPTLKENAICIEKDSQISNLKRELEQKKGEFAFIKEEARRKEEQLKQTDFKKEINLLLEPIIKPINLLATKVNVLVPDDEENSSNKNISNLFYIILVNLILILGLVLYFGLSSKPINSTISNIKTEKTK